MKTDKLNQKLYDKLSISQSGLHLVLCYYALGDTEKMKKAFQYLLDVPMDFNEDEKLINSGTNPSHGESLRAFSKLQTQ